MNSNTPGPQEFPEHWQLLQFAILGQAVSLLYSLGHDHPTSLPLLLTWHLSLQFLYAQVQLTDSLQNLLTLALQSRR